MPVSLRRQFEPGQSSANCRPDNFREPAVVAEFTMIKGEHALIEVSEQVVGLNADVRAMQAALQERPEVLDVVRVNLPFDVADHMWSIRLWS